MTIEEAFREYMRTGVAPKGYYLDKRKYWQSYNRGLSSEDAKSRAFKAYGTRKYRPAPKPVFEITRMSGFKLKKLGEL